MRYTRWGVFVALVAGAAVVAALVGTTGGNAAPTKKTRVVIGWAYDSSGQMAPFDNPALAAAKIEAARINAQIAYTCDGGTKVDVFCGVTT